jgi:hypothetical protein
MLILQLKYIIYEKTSSFIYFYLSFIRKLYLKIARIMFIILLILMNHIYIFKINFTNNLIDATIAYMMSTNSCIYFIEKSN